ncbi:hypothetical protein [Glycomyces salinus]|uniref:hypothetical protein n=1 Tax=Glycomyces salinus TaxID=980294 RepID=UPI0018EC127D|nr:hypothetical protein [Glycomyces salinus]
MRNKLRVGLFSTSVAVAVAGFASPAMAEGSWDSYFNGVRDGFETRSWHDNQSDSVNTVSTIDNCEVRDSDGDYKYGSIEQILYRERSLRPDVSYGDLTSDCDSSSDSVSWDPGSEGDFHITFDDIIGGVVASADTHDVSY